MEHLKKLIPNMEQNQRGQSLVLVAFMIIGLVAFVGIAVDVGFIYARRAQLSAAVDAAALAGAIEAVGTGGIGAANAQAKQYLHSNNIPVDVTTNSFESIISPPDLLGIETYAITVTWPVELFFLRVIGRESVDLVGSATAAYFPLADLYASKRVEDGALSTSNQSVFGPNVCTSYGDPVSPVTGNPDWGILQGVYHYRIMIPADYPSTVLRVELFDPDSMNQDEDTHAISHTDIAINGGFDPVEEKTCSQTNQQSPCLIKTQENTLPGVTPDQINLWWFVRIDENRGAGAAPGTGGCDYPPNYSIGHNTKTRYSLFYYARTPDGNIQRIPLAEYTGQSGWDDASYGDYDKVRNTVFADHQTDMQWVAPGGAEIFDQLAAVPTDCGSNNGGYSIPGTGDGGNPEREGPGGRCYIAGAPQDQQPLYSPPGLGRGFDIDLTRYYNIIVDETTGARYIYFDVQSLVGASENGFEIWAGPPDYVNTASSNVNVRNVEIVNEPGSHHSKGATVFGLGRIPMNSNSPNTPVAPVDIPLVYIGPEYAGEEVYISMFDPDTPYTKPPIWFYFDSIAFEDYNIEYGSGEDPDNRCFEGGESYDNWCNNKWVTPDFVVKIPDLTNDASCPGGDPAICTPYYGGRLFARYRSGQNDTYSWRVILSGLPYLVK